MINFNLVSNCKRFITESLINLNKTTALVISILFLLVSTVIYFRKSLKELSFSVKKNSPSVPSPQLSDKEIEKLAGKRKPLLMYDSSSPQIINTGLTERLAQDTFSNQPNLNFDATNTLLNKLVKAASTNPNARLALLRPNNYDQQINHDGFPQNTPLMLLIKARNFEGIKTVLSVYDAPALLLTTPRGNSILHIAIITGQMDAALEIGRRALELGILDQLLAMKNSTGKTAGDLFSFLMKHKNVFNNFEKETDLLLGGEEIHKARSKPEQILNARQYLCEPFSKKGLKLKSVASQPLENFLCPSFLA